MQLIKPDINIDFVGKRKLALLFSIVILVVGAASLVVNGGPSYGIDFSGGTLVQIKIGTETGPTEVKEALADLNLGGLVVQTFGDNANEFLIRAANTSSELEGLNKDINLALSAKYGAEMVELRRSEMVGPKVGADLREKGFLAILYAMIGILFYITWRFEFRFAIGAIIALIHDISITLGAFSVFGKEIDLPIIAAFLAIIGYSLNDTIIVYDRIRENMGKMHKEEFGLIINRSINETLSRTILTSGTTLLVVAALFVFGGGVIHDFAFALLIGVLVGTYSSIFIASPLLIYWDNFKAARKAAGSTT
ncbi:MAG: protein translocase subunit SecF [Desulfuromonas sp.]|nr:MAG: protein translocase subunit SecF [Desulfuromonas sp.]